MLCVTMRIFMDSSFFARMCVVILCSFLFPQFSRQSSNKTTKLHLIFQERQRNKVIHLLLIGYIVIRGFYNILHSHHHGNCLGVLVDKLNYLQKVLFAHGCMGDGVLTELIFKLLNFNNYLYKTCNTKTHTHAVLRLVSSFPLISSSEEDSEKTFFYSLLAFESDSESH